MELACIASENTTWYNHLRHSLAVSHEVKHAITVRPSIYTSEHLSQETKVCVFLKTCTLIL